MNTQNKTRTILTLAILAMAVFAGTAMAALETELGILDVSGINPGTGAPWAAGDQYRFAFITSTTILPDDPNILHYNGLVQDLADDSVLAIGAFEGVAWYVIGSTDTVDARDNTMTNPEDPNDPNCPIFLLDGTTVVAINKADLWDGEVAHIIDQDENGNTKTSWPLTGTYKDGTKAPGHPVSYNAFGGGGQTQQGNSTVTTDWIWRQWTGAPISELLPMYAMSGPLTLIEGDPTIPTVNLGADMITWSDESVPMVPDVDNNLGSVPLEYAWVAETTDINVDILLSPNSGDPLLSSDPNPTVTITKNDSGGLVTVKVTLTVNNVGYTNFKSDFMNIDAYDDACAVANAVSPGVYDAGDINEDCITDLKDFAEMAAEWLNNYELTQPEIKV